MSSLRILFVVLTLTFGLQGQTLLSVTHGTVTNGLLGNAMCPGPDWDGDGVPDVMAGAPEDPSHQSFPPIVFPAPLPFAGSGQVEVISGATGAILTTVPGPYLGGRYGFALHSPGDLDGDGVRDVMVGEPARPNNLGHVDVLSGATLQPLFPALAPSYLPSSIAMNCTAGWLADDWLFGHTLASAGDVNGDGVPDISVGAPFGFWSLFTTFPRVVTYSGADGSIIAASCSMFGVSYDLGWSMADAIDVNGDGVKDMVATNLGLAHLQTFSGVDGSFLGFAQVIDGFYGYSCVQIPDQDGDGVEDIAVSAPTSQASGLVKSGRVVFHSGASLAVIGNMYGQYTGAHMGWSMDARGDYDGDGVNDLAIGLPGFWHNAGNIGAVEVYSGATLQLLARMVSPVADNAFGWSVAFVGDLTGDGRAELAVGAPTETAAGVAAAGAVYIYSGLEPPPGVVGNVGLPLTGPEAVLTINASSGGSAHRVTVGLGQPFTLGMAQPTTLSAPAGFSLFAAVGLPTALTVLPTVFGDFSIIPQPAAPANPLLFHVADSLGFGNPIVAATPAPWSLTVSPGLPQPLLLTFQGLIDHMTVPFPSNLAITNAVILDVQ